MFHFKLIWVLFLSISRYVCWVVH